MAHDDHRLVPDRGHGQSDGYLGDAPGGADVVRRHAAVLAGAHWAVPRLAALLGIPHAANLVLEDHGGEAEG